MSCLSDCGCKRSDQEADPVEERETHVEASYQPLLEATNAPETIPLLLKEPTMLKFEAQQDQYQLLALIGEGLNQAARISLAQHILSGHHVAIRCIDLEACSEDITYIQQEILLTRQLKHESLLPYLSTFVTGSQVWAVMPLMCYGSARSLLKDQFPDGLPEIAVAFILKDILSALVYIHRRGFIHRSIRASHILLNSKGRAVLGGLRYSCNVFQRGRWQSSIHAYPHDAKPNLNWLSPELLHQNLVGYNAKSDIYSVGVTAIELTNGVVPFAHLGPTQMLLEKLGHVGHQHSPSSHNQDSRNVYSTADNNSLLLVDSNGSQGYAHQKQNQENHRLSRGQKACNNSENHSTNSSMFTTQVYSEAFASFVHLCLQKDPKLRPTAAQLLTHGFIKQCKKSQVTLLDILAKATHLVETHEKAEVLEDESEVPIDRLQTFEINDSWSF